LVECVRKVTVNGMKQNKVFCEEKLIPRENDSHTETDFGGNDFMVQGSSKPLKTNQGELALIMSAISLRFRYNKLTHTIKGE